MLALNIVQSFLFKDFLLEFLQSNISLNCNSTYYIVLSLIYRYSNVLLYVCIQSYNINLS